MVKRTIEEVEDHEQTEDYDEDDDAPSGPQFVVTFKNKDVIKDIADLIIHQVQRQTGMHKKDKRRAKLLMLQFIPDLYDVPRREVPDDDMEIDDVNENSKAGCQEQPVATLYPYRCVPNFSASGDVSDGQEKNCSDEETSVVNQDSNVENSAPDDSYSLFFANENWFTFLRLYYVLYERVGKIYDCSQALLLEQHEDKKETEEATTVLSLKPEGNCAVEEYYTTFLNMVKSLLDQSIDANQYANTLRGMFGIEAYCAFTLDKIVQNVVKQLQLIVGDDSCMQCTTLFWDEVKFQLTSGMAEPLSQHFIKMWYHIRAKRLLGNENCYEVIIYKNDRTMTVELLDPEFVHMEAVGVSDEWSHDFDNSTTYEPSPIEIKEHIMKHPVFLHRNVRAGQQRISSEDGIVKIIQDEMASPNDITGGDLDSKIDSSRSFVIDKVSGDSDICSGIIYTIGPYKPVCGAHTKNFMFKKSSLLRARQVHEKVSSKLNKNFHAWHKKWLKENVSEEDTKKCVDWMIGNTDKDGPNVC